MLIEDGENFMIKKVNWRGRELEVNLVKYLHREGYAAYTTLQMEGRYFCANTRLASNQEEAIQLVLQNLEENIKSIARGSDLQQAKEQAEFLIKEEQRKQQVAQGLLKIIVQQT